MAPERRSTTASTARPRRQQPQQQKRQQQQPQQQRRAKAKDATAAASSAAAAATGTHSSPVATPLQLSLLPLRAAGWHPCVGEPLTGALVDGRVVVQLLPLLRLLGYASSGALGSAVGKYDQSLARWVDGGGCDYDDLATCKAAISPRLRLAPESQRDARFVSKEGFKWLIKVLNEWEPKRQPLATVADARCRRKIRDALFTLPPAVAVTLGPAADPSSAAASSVASTVAPVSAAPSPATSSPRPALSLSRSSSNGSSSSHSSGSSSESSDDDAHEERKEGPASPTFSPAHAPMQPFRLVPPPLPPARALPALPSFDNQSPIASSGSVPEAASYVAFTAAAAAAASFVAAASSPCVAPVPALPPLAASLALHYAAETLAVHPERVAEVERIIEYLQSLLPHAYANAAPPPPPPISPPDPVSVSASVSAAASASASASLDPSLAAPILPPLEIESQSHSHSHAASPVASVAAPSRSPSSAATATVTAAASASASNSASPRLRSAKRPARPSDAFDSDLSTGSSSAAAAAAHAATAADASADAFSPPPPSKRARLLLPPGPLATFEMGQCWRSLKASGRMYVVQPSPMHVHEQMLPSYAN